MFEVTYYNALNERRHQKFETFTEALKFANTWSRSMRSINEVKGLEINTATLIKQINTTKH